MKRIVMIATIAAALLMSGCATGYQSIDEGISGGGYTETRLTPNSWRVFFGGNSFTTRKETEQLLMRRCAELTLEQGRRYFDLSDHEAWVKVRRTRDSGVVRLPANEAIVIALESDSGNSFDAVSIIQETNGLAKGRLSQRASQTLDKITSAQS